MNPRWRTAQCFKTKYLTNETRYERAVLKFFPMRQTKFLLPMPFRSNKKYPENIRISHENVFLIIFPFIGQQWPRVSSVGIVITHKTTTDVHVLASYCIIKRGTNAYGVKIRKQTITNTSK